MRMIILVWLFLMAGGLGALLLRKDSGYALLSWDVWSVEMSLAMLALLLVVLFATVYFLLRLINHLFAFPSRVHGWQDAHHRRRAQRALTHGLLQLAEGEWEKSEHSLVQHAEQSETPLLNYLGAARAAQAQAAHDRRDGYLRLAHQHMPSADVAVGLTQAELQLAEQQLEQALATLKHLRGIAPRHHYVLRLLARLYEQLGDWDHLLELLPELKRNNVLDEAQLTQIEIRSISAKLDLAAQTDSLDEIWNPLSRTLKQDHQLLYQYASHLHTRSRDNVAEPLLRQALEQQWDEQMVMLYGLLDGDNSKQQLRCAEDLLLQQPHNPVLLLALGRLSLKAKLWGKARGYLEASIGASGPVDAYHELGHLLETMEKPEDALAIYRDGLRNSGGAAVVPLAKKLGRLTAISSDA